MAFVINAGFFERRYNGFADMGNGVRHLDAYRIERLDFVSRRALAAAPSAPAEAAPAAVETAPETAKTEGK